MMRPVIGVVVLLLSLLAVPARADLMIAFSEDGSAVDFSVIVGQTVDVPVYVFEIDGTILTDMGLKTAGVQIRYAETGTNASVNDVDTDVILASHWEQGPPLADKLIDRDTRGNYVEMASGIPIGADPVKGPAILIGTLRFTGNVGGDVTEISSGDIEYIFPIGEPVIISGANRVLDDDVFATVTTARIFTSPVPEPSSIVLAMSGCAIMGFVMVARRRRRSK